MSEQSSLSHFGSGDPPQTDQYECGICGRSFDSAVGRGNHMPRSHSEDEIKTELIAELCSLADRLGRTPTQREMNQRGIYPANMYRTKFDSWNNALTYADLVINKESRICKPTLLDGLQDLADELGRTPRQQDMKQKGDYGVSTYTTAFGSWNEALVEADLEVNSRYGITESDLLDGLQGLADELGRTPRVQDMKQKGDYGVSTYTTAFGSWNKALREAGLEINRENSIDKSTLLDGLQNLADEVERVPTKREMDQQGSHAVNSYRRAFGSWNEALVEAGLEINEVYETDRSTLVDGLQNLADELGRAPTGREMNQQGEWSRDVYAEQFGSWNEALVEAGLEINEVYETDRSTLVDALQDLADELGRAPTGREMNQQGECTLDSYLKQFDSWIDALDKVGLKHQRIRYPNHLDHKVRSTYEEDIADILLDEDVEYEYESCVIEYGDGRTYTPDFVTDQYVIEVKGYTHTVGLEDYPYADAVEKAEIAMEQLIKKQYVVIQDNGSELPADRHIQWSEREKLRQLL